jgi:two-component system, NtrC family, nitrogen regulation sensor histidine kinase NtrY
MRFSKFSLRIRIFLSMTLLMFVAFIMIAVVTEYQYREQTQEYNTSRFERKEDAIRLNMQYGLSNSAYALETGNLKKIFKQRVFEVAAVHKATIKIYDLQGKLLLCSTSNVTTESILLEDLKKLKQKNSYRLIQGMNEEGKSLQASYTYIQNNEQVPIGILKLHYLQDNSAQEKDLNEFLSRVGLVYVLLFFFAIGIAYFLSSYITKSIGTVISKMSQAGFYKRNEKIILADAPSEIRKLVSAYNDMVDKLEESAEKLAKSEREQAWREMARQVAHEIKNPLTPMRLTVQSFEQKFNPEDIEIRAKVKEYSRTLIQQIDVMSSIASAFSDFAQMPTKRKENVEVVTVVKIAIDLFDKAHVSYKTSAEKIYLQIDKTQLVRVVNNLVQNSIHATKKVEHPDVAVRVTENTTHVEIQVKDNGKGITEELKNKVFEPRFTTKTSGMGLGLPMIKKIIESYQGSLSFVSEEGKGTIFKVLIPKES